MKDLSAKASCRVTPATSSASAPLPPPPATNAPRGAESTWGRWSAEVVPMEQALRKQTTREEADTDVPATDGPKGYFANVGAQASAKWQEVGGWTGVGEKVVASAQSVQEKAKDLDQKHNISEKVKRGMVKTEVQLRENAKRAKA